MPILYGLFHCHEEANWTEEEKKKSDEIYDSLDEIEKGLYHNSLPPMMMVAEVNSVREETVDVIIKRNVTLGVLREEQVEYWEKFLKKIIGYTTNIGETKTGFGWMRKMKSFLKELSIPDPKEKTV